jgi:hypothetical protein
MHCRILLPGGDMPRKLDAIEIAEGALLANIAVVFQLLVLYLPVGGIVFALLVPTVFTVLVLRRGFYASIMGLCVALFIVGLLTGLGSVQLMLLEVGAGTFLGVTMKFRLHYIPLILLGVTGSAIGLSILTLLNVLLLGKAFLATLLMGFRNSFAALFSVMNFVAPGVGLGGWWHSTYPTARHLADLMLSYWVITLFVGNWLFLIPVVIAVYYITAFLVRLLGYNVRPFPDGWMRRFIRWIIHILTRIAMKLGLEKYWTIRTLIKEIRRQSIGLGRQKTNP